jgi:glycosyltransferase 2 family protein
MRQTAVARSSVAASTVTKGWDAGTARVPHAPSRWRWLRPVGGLAVMVAVVWWFGADAFVAGARTVSAGPVAAALGIAVVTTVASAWRWRVVAHGLGLRLPWRTAVAGCYRSQFLNVVLPGGVVGDVHRGVEHGRDSADLARGLRAVACERSAGQVVQLTVVLLALLVLPSPLRAMVAGSAGAGVVSALLAAVVVAAAVLRLHGRRRVRSRALRTALADIRHGLLARRAWPAVVLTSVVIVAGHATAFLVAARAAGADASLARLAPLVLLVLVASGLPLNIAGWGPREGAAGWVFGLAGMSAQQGVATAVVYGVMVLAASLPGAVVLLASPVRRSTAHCHA